MMKVMHAKGMLKVMHAKGMMKVIHAKGKHPSPVSEHTRKWSTLYLVPTCEGLVG